MGVIDEVKDLASKVDVNEIKKTAQDIASKVDKQEIKNAADKALNSGAAEKVIDKVSEVTKKNISKDAVKEGLDKILG